MFRVCLISICLALMVTTAWAGRKKDKAGSVENGVYTDDSYSFSLTLPQNWKSKIYNDKDNIRLSMTQSNFEVPNDYIKTPEHTKVPRITVFSDTTSMSLMDFIDSLVSSSYKSGQKKEMLKEFEILHSGPLGDANVQPVSPRRRSPITVGEQQGVIWSGQSKYIKEISVSASSVGGKRVDAAYGGSILALKKDRTIVVFHLICEWLYFPALDKDLQAVAGTLKWNRVPSEAEKESGNGG